jgi:hypothetical protein
MIRHRLMMLFSTLALAGPAAWAGTWVYVSRGDCPGPLVRGSAGERPDRELCTPEFEGKTALCYTQNCNPGCDYVDVPTPDCRGGAELVDVYTCRASAAGQ